MCLGVPMRVVEIEPSVGELGGIRCRINLSLLEDVSVGDYVIVHAGYAIEKLEEGVAKQTIRLMQDLSNSKQ
ncbi:MAG TPA: HypC/HybG/HupF family hydrogenase formation chaperone [Candidatus Hypogeohydataceae bacterium YC41]